jgi:tetratricopeptide (TPR) repeat protein
MEVARLDPLGVESHRSLTALLADTDGRAAARTHLGQVVQKFPHAHPLLKLRAEFLSGDPDADADRALQDMLDECPDDAWALRQRALVLADRKQTDAALAAVERAGELEPGHPWYYAVLAQVRHRADRQEEAVAACRESLRANVDQEPLIAELMQLSRGRQEKEEALRFLADQLERQLHTGEGLIAFVAQSHLSASEPEDHQELLEYLERMCDDRPDLWHVWSVLVQQLAGMNRLEEANEVAREATVRFPLLSKLWLDRAQVAHAMGNAEGRLDCLRQAVAVSPGWSLAARELAEALEEASEPDESIAVLTRTAARSPLDPFAHGFLAEQLWEAGRSREALDRAKRAVRHEPGYDWAWHAIQVWAERLEVPDEPAELCRELCRDRAGDPRVWLRLARLLHHPRHAEEVLTALDKAIALEPKNVEAHDLKAERLAEIGKFDEALAAAQPPQLAGELPFVLQGRVAWVEAKRGNYAAAIPPMQALVAVDPTYVWGWHQLAEWYNETGRPQGYLEAASELVRLQPGHPVALMMRGEAKLQTGDRDGGKADLRDALKVSAGYSHAAALLFEAHLEDDEFREARQALAVLQEHAAGPEVSLRQLQLACKTDDPDAAVRAFAEICEGPGQSPHPIQAALEHLKAAGWEGRAERVLRESWQSGGPFHPWAPLFWVDSDDGREAEPGERLRAAEAAINSYPKFLPGYDCKAEQLAVAGRYDEALTACRPPELGDPPPLELRGRAAWVEARRGDRSKAIALMKQVVAEDPEFVLGWRQLAAWYDAAGRYRECLDAAEQFVKLEPANAVAYVYRGEAKRNVGDRRGALADFQKAAELDPSFEAAGVSLIAEQLATGDVPGAARALATLQEHADGPLVRLRAVQVACRQGEFDSALSRFRGLAADAEVSRGVLREAVMAFDVEEWGPKLTAELKDLAFADGANPDVVGLWAERTVEAGAIDAVADRIPELLVLSPAAGREAVLAYVRAMTVAGRPVQGAVQKYSEILRSDDDSWARAGDLLVGAGNHALAAAWLADWRERESVEAWMLRPLTAALRALDQDDKAVEVCRAAVRLGGPDDQLADFRVWLALDLALSGQAEEAAALLSRVDSVTAADGTRLILSLAEAAVMVLRAGPGGKAAAFAEAKEHLRTAAGSVAAKDVPAGAVRAYRKVISRLAADAGTLSARVWSIWQRFAPWVK